MKKYLAIILLPVLVGFAWAGSDSFTNYPGTMSVWGVPGATKTVNVDNAARTIQALYEAGGGTWLGGYDSTIVPIGVLITCPTTDTRWAFGGSTPSATVGHVLPADSSWFLVGPAWISTGKGYGNTASDNVACQMTPVR
jgi:hypothetical protein